MQKSLNNNNFYVGVVHSGDVNDSSFRLHSPKIYNGNCLEVCHDLRFCMKSRTEKCEEDEYSYCAKIVDEIYPNIENMPEKPFAIKTSIIAIKKEYF